MQKVAEEKEKGYRCLIWTSERITKKDLENLNQVIRDSNSSQSIMNNDHEDNEDGINLKKQKLSHGDEAQSNQQESDHDYTSQACDNGTNRKVLEVCTYVCLNLRPSYYCYILRYHWYLLC
jgi:hypothetical protein